MDFSKSLILCWDRLLVNIITPHHKAKMMSPFVNKTNLLVYFMFKEYFRLSNCRYTGYANTIIWDINHH